MRGVIALILDQTSVAEHLRGGRRTISEDHAEEEPPVLRDPHQLRQEDEREGAHQRAEISEAAEHKS